ncbi:YqgE/AlgH family protein [Thalassococcus lentus]|uniref:UPF0301 protein PFY00_00525 n=2 Tax=Thalassococcus lentus TaxID=1210524 RepID=A0ABT4XMM9_9RHOB|nr:YqgE/AlgH family protein [Thalassococcus lentus]MDA7423195.1 YqgE/AlgH family protein [Thalassococcus lentus]
MTGVRNFEISDLTGRTLIAMPGMGDPRFAHSVVFLCDHSEEGAMGLIINKPNRDVAMKSLLGQLDIDAGTHLENRVVYFGGPVEMGRGFVLHSSDYLDTGGALEVVPGVHMTGTLDILEELARGEGPSQWLMMLGYAGWGPRQLEDEIAANGWLVCDLNAEQIFGLPDNRKWEAALETLGVSSLVLSSEGGRA